MKITTIFYLALYFVVRFELAIASDPYENLFFKHLTINDGLSQNLVEKIAQDHQGFIWLGTNDGLNRYDGKELRVYRNDPTLPGSISGNDIHNIFQSKKGDLWVLANGINVYNRHRDTFNQVSGPSILKSHLNDITHISEDRNGDIWIVVNGVGLFRIHEKGTANHASDNNVDNQPSTSYVFTGPYLVDMKKQKSDDTNLFLDILVDQENTMWVATKSGIHNLYAKSSGEFPNPKEAVFNNIDIGLQLEKEPQISILEDKNETLWFGTHFGMVKHSLNKNDEDSFYVYSYPDGLFEQSWKGAVSDIEEDENGVLWMGTYAGLLLFEPKTGLYKKIVNIPGNDASIGVNNIRCIYRDKGNLMWVGTAGMGADKTKINYKSFSHHLDKSFNGNIHSTYSIALDNSNKIWFIDSDGIVFQYDQMLKSLDRYDFAPSAPTIACDILIDKQNDMYFGAGKYLYHQTSSTGKLTKHTLWKSEHIYDPADSVPLIHIDQQDQIWLCNTGNLFHFNPINGKIKRHKILFGNLEKVNSLYRDKNGVFWIGTMKGLIRYNILTNRQDLFDQTTNSKATLPFNQIFDIEPHPDSSLLWIATGGGGFFSFDRETLEIKHFTVRNGLANNFVYCILIDDAGHLWLSTNLGISRFDPSDNSFTNYTVEDGLQSNEFNRYSKYKSKSGEFFFGGINGITAFFPNQIKSNPHVPQIIITDFYLSNKPINQFQKESPLYAAINVTEKIELNHNQNNVSFRFTALDFLEPKNNKYSYFLKNFDKNWVDAGTNGYASYTNLPPGDYVFQAKGSNNDEIWNEQPKQIYITIHPPFWQTWWAYMIYILLAILVIYFIHKSQKARIVLHEQLKYEKRESQKLTELDEFKSQFFTGISHEFRTPLTLILGNLDDWIKETDQEAVREKFKSLKKYSFELMQLVNQLLDLARVESGQWKLNYEYSDIVTQVKGIISQFKHHASQKRISLDLYSAVDELYMDLDQSSVQKILQNLISNAIKFSPPDQKIQINLRYQYTKEWKNSIPALQIEVIDKGVGIEEKHLSNIFNRFYQVKRSKSHDHTGFGIGLWFCKELVEKLNGRISVKSEINSGSTFTIELPVNHTLKDNHHRELLPATENNDIGLTENEKQVDTIEDVHKENDNVILVVEDHPDLRSFLVKLLSREYSVIQATNGHEGLELAIANIPDIIISDIMMPELNGFEMASKIKEDFRTDHIPFLFLTAKTDEKDKLDALKLGINDYIYKPFGTEELLLRIKNLLYQRDKLIHHFQTKTELDEPDEKLSDFLQDINRVIDRNIENEQLGVEFLCDKLNMSRSQLHRKLKAITDQTAVQIIQNARLRTASNMLDQGYQVSETAYKVGYNSVSHFSKLFKDRFGYSPKEFAKKERLKHERNT